MKNYKPILVVAGEPNSIFLEIFFKSIKKIKIKNPIILICSFKLLSLQMRKLNIKKKIRIIKHEKIFHSYLNNSCINLIDVNYKAKSAFSKVTNKSNEYIKNCFELAIYLIKKKGIYKFINGPINKKIFLKKNHLGITEYISKKFRIKKKAMLIYNKKLSVCTVTTHLPIKLVSKKINQSNIMEKIELIENFYNKNLSIKPRIGVLGLNPHCESILNYNEDDKIIKPLVKKMLKKGLRISGPISADTAFLKNNRKNYDVIIGMYHDQVITPIKTIFEYDAINITLGLPFFRVSPDHGPNVKMLGKNLSNPLSLIQALKFLDKN